jgi:cytoskeletal protein RodZ
MDKFDEIIKDAKEEYQPKTNFVEATMAHINPNQPRKRWNMKLWGSVFAGGLAMAAIAFVVVPLVGHNPSATTQSSTGASQQASSSSSQSASGSQGSAAAGTTNADLQGDLSGINGSMNQANSDQTSANSAVNDSQQQVSIPQD